MATAAVLFAARGYHRVGVDEVAEAVGITGGAIYRHFGTKADLLARTVTDALDVVEGAMADAGVTGLVPLGLDHPHVFVLLDREARHLPSPGPVQVRLAGLASTAVRAVRRARPQLDEEDAALLVRSAVAAAGSPAYHRVALPRDQAETVLVATVERILSSAAVPGRGDGTVLARTPTARASRREALLAAATALFARNGYQAVRMEEIGSAAGISGTSVYQHFPGKADLLVAAFNRGAEWLQFGLSEALASTGSDPQASLEAVVASYVDFVLTHRDLMGLLLTESVHLPDAELRVLRRTQHDYVAEWLEVVSRARPELGETEARFRTHAALAIVNDAARPGRPPPRPTTADGLAGLAVEAVRG